MKRSRQSLVIASLLCLALPACGQRNQHSAGSVETNGPSQPASSEMTEHGAIEHIQSLARNGALKTTVPESYWDFDRKEYRSRVKQANVPDGVAWRATKDQNGMWRVEGEYTLEGAQHHAVYVVDSQTMSVSEVPSSG